MKVHRILSAAVVLGIMIATPLSTGASTAAKSPHATYALGKAKHCRPDFVKRTERHKVKGKERRYIACIFTAPQVATTSAPIATTSAVPAAASTVQGTATPSGSAVSSTSSSTGTARANIDPAYVQNSSNPLDVTFQYSASETDGNLPNGVLSLYWGATAQSQTLACSINVGGSVAGGTCEVVFSAYGPEVVTVQYVSGTTSATQTDTENIQNPNPVPTTTTLAPSSTVTESWTDVQSGPGTGYPVFTITAAVVDQNGNSVALSSGQVTFELVSPGGTIVATSTPSTGGVCDVWTDTDGLNDNLVQLCRNGQTTAWINEGTHAATFSTADSVVAVYNGGNGHRASAPSAATIGFSYTY